MSAQHPPEPRELDDSPERARQEAELRAEHDRRTALPTMGLGALMVVLAVAVLVQAMQLPSGQSAVGPATLMWVVGALLFIVGGMTIRTGLCDRGRADTGQPDGGAHRPESGSRQDWLRMLALLGLLIVFAVALGWVGYVVSATFLFGTSAIVLGAPYRLRSFVYGWVIAVVVYLAFDTGIGLSLPAGPWGF